MVAVPALAVGPVGQDTTRAVAATPTPMTRHPRRRSFVADSFDIAIASPRRGGALDAAAVHQR
jgi:hypothetical protein